jgi:hypothetical protein
MKKLESSHLHTLSGAEFRAYFEHRIKNILVNKFALTGNELEYLLCEVGPGNLRTDPEFVPLITKKASFIFKDTYYPDLEDLLNKKIDVENYILKSINSAGTQRLLFNIINPYITHAHITSIEPFIIAGKFEGIPVSCLIQNGKWILPNKELFTFLQKCQTQKMFPILISKKISGILFPVFKNISVLGFNAYKVFLPKAGQHLVENTNENREGFREIKYCNQFCFFDGSGTPEGQEAGRPANLIRAFFTAILKNNIHNYQPAFFNSTIDIKDNFLDTVSQFKKNNANKNLIKTYMMRQDLLTDLKKTKF